MKPDVIGITHFLVKEFKKIKEFFKIVTFRGWVAKF